jgi:hypothetical protein
MSIFNQHLLSEINVSVSYTRISHTTMPTNFTVDSKVHVLKYY